MRSVVYGSAIIAVLAFVGMAQAANALDGKAILCKDHLNKNNPYFGFVFDAGKVTRWEVQGYLKVNPYYVSPSYFLIGPDEVLWDGKHGKQRLNRRTLRIGFHQCSVSSKKGIFLKLDEIIANAKKKNKI